MAAGHTAGARVEPHREPFPGHVAAPLPDLERAGEEGAVIVHPPGFDGGGLGAAALARGQRREVLGRDRGVEVAVAILEEGLAHVMNDIVFLARHHPALGHHEAGPVGERAIHAVGIAASLELPLRKP